MRVREGSVADKVMRMCNWIDCSRAGQTIGAIGMGVLIVGMFAYGMWSYPI